MLNAAPAEFPNQTLRLVHRKLMREWALMFRSDLEFARRYREYHPAVYERWLIKAGENVARAKEERDWKPVATPPGNG